MREAILRRLDALEAERAPIVFESVSTYSKDQAPPEVKEACLRNYEARGELSCIHDGVLWVGHRGWIEEADL